jgi:tRNA A-37 threonylcarbamoyl transferase component Bud32/DNA-binding response OmpR family regulator
VTLPYFDIYQMLQRILIIDDAEDIEFLVRFCTHAYWPDAILEMYDPRCGLPEKSFNWSRYDLLLLDYELGLTGQNGLDWLAQLVKDDHLPPVIMLTGYASDKLAKKALDSGIDGFLDKNTLTPETFSNTVNSIFTAIKQGNRRPSDTRVSAEKTEYLSAEDKQRILQSVESKVTDKPQEEEFEKTRLLPAENNVPETDSVVKSDETTSQALPSTTTTSSRVTTSSFPQKPRQSADISIFVPGYTISKKIGEGGMASIYLAERDDDKLMVVLKVLSLENNDDSSLLRRFMREYKLIAQIQHPNIVQIYERAFASTFAYIAMEYFSHGDLAERLKRGLDSRTAINYLHQITEGLGAAHAKGIVHRDMKPANILFRSEDSLAITDFGIAKTVESDQLKRQLTVDGALMGTLYYISPEQIMGKEADQRSDIYSLGVIMYKMLTGNHPYVGSSPTEVFEGHLSAPIPLLPEKFSSLQPLLDGLLAKDPDERFQSTDDLLMGLNWKEWS